MMRILVEICIQDSSLSWVTLVTFGALSVVAAAFAIFLPETRGKKLPEFIEDSVILKEEGFKTNAQVEGVRY